MRVESSKNRLTTVRPRRVGSFLIGAVGEAARAPRRCRGPAARRRGSRSAAESRWRFIGASRRAGRWPAPSIRARSSSPSTSVELHLDALGQARWAGSCRRSRRGSAARGGRGRPARRAGRARGRPRSPSASSAARMVRPEKSTSSTRRPRSCRRCRRRGRRCGSRARAGSQPQVVAVHRDVERADRDRRALDARRCASASRRARGTPRVGMPSRTRSSAPLLRSRISWAIRVRARAMSAASSTGRRGRRCALGSRRGRSCGRAGG